VKQYIGLGSLIFLILWANSSPAIDCRLGSEYYHRARSEPDPNRSIEWLNQSVQVCPNFNAWYMLGLLYSNQGETDQAIDAFIHAKAAAGSVKTEALALARQGELLSRTRQWPRALRAFELAKRFHPDPAPDWLEDSLKNARIQTYQTIIPATDIAHIFETGTQISMDGRFAVRPAVNLPVHFAFDQANLNPAGNRQVIELGRALARIQMEQWSFLLVGHTDKRGSKAYNQVLSDKRADTVKVELERQFPSLAGRLKARGRGETELLYDGESEVDHMLNRRVKVTLLSD
jgi:outer membrane protein OmpA-like peptidoglycan-associated protein